ncbi:MAG: tetratricopeptide repeat protein, partial [Planctomycetota bacterium]
MVWLVCLTPAAAGQEAKGPARTAAQKAAQVYASALSAMRARQYRQAVGLFEKYVKTYASHEHVPVGYLLLASCRETLKDDDAYETALTDVTRRYTGSPAWFTAYKHLLDRARQGKDPDAYLRLLESMVRPLVQAPWRIGGRISWDHGHYRHNEYNGRQFWPHAAHLQTILHEPGWVMGVAEMADTEQRAGRALQVLAKNFRKRRNE